MTKESLQRDNEDPSNPDPTQLEITQPERSQTTCRASEEIDELALERIIFVRPRN